MQSLKEMLLKIANRDQSEDLSRMMESIYPHTGRARIWGLEDSTLVDALTTHLEQAGKKVALLAIHGESIRVQDLTIRAHSVPHTTKELLHVLDAAGFDVILVTVVQTGQEILKLTQLVIGVSEAADVSPASVEDLVAKIEAHQEQLIQTGEQEKRAREVLQTEVFDILTERLNHSVRQSFMTQSGESVLRELLGRKIDPYKAANLISNQ